MVNYFYGNDGEDKFELFKVDERHPEIKILDVRHHVPHALCLDRAVEVGFDLFSLTNRI